jgi:hypothetical protein
MLEFVIKCYRSRDVDGQKFVVRTVNNSLTIWRCHCTTSLVSGPTEVPLGGLDVATDLGEIFVEQDQVLTDLKIKAKASHVAMKVQTNEIERLKK